MSVSHKLLFVYQVVKHTLNVDQGPLWNLKNSFKQTKVTTVLRKLT